MRTASLEVRSTLVDALASLQAQVAGGALASIQRDALVAVWEDARAREPALRPPAVGVSADGVLQTSWAFADLPGRTFTLELFRDGTLEWFFRDAATGEVSGTADEPERGLPPQALALLVDAFAAGRGTRWAPAPTPTDPAAPTNHAPPRAQREPSEPGISKQ